MKHFSSTFYGANKLDRTIRKLSIPAPTPPSKYLHTIIIKDVQANPEYGCYMSLSIISKDSTVMDRSALMSWLSDAGHKTEDKAYPAAGYACDSENDLYGSVFGLVSDGTAMYAEFAQYVEEVDFDFYSFTISAGATVTDTVMEIKP